MKKNTPILVFLSFTIFFLSVNCSDFQKSQKTHEWKEAESAGYTYKYVSNDPSGARFYTLKNGMKVILSVNKRKPRIAVNIAVRSGSNNDPKDYTGLAHYLEHILFKGTDKFGTLNWTKEKPYLDEIEKLYEEYNRTTDQNKRSTIYKKIDEISNKASKYAIANEYDKLMSNLGSVGTNAHTWMEETVYKENIPSNTIDKFLEIQAERFRNPIIRLFHTELEVVYEEKNRTMNSDRRKVHQKINSLLFPTHNYGQQTTIGKIEHLKNPSIKAIKAYYNKNYVPNNMAIIMVGDFDPDTLISKIDSHISFMKSKPLSPYNPAPEKPLTKPQFAEVFGPTPDYASISWRLPASETEDATILTLVDAILKNGKAGLIDVDITQKQKLQKSQVYLSQYKDYGVLTLSGTPKEGQTLDQVKTIFLEEIDKLRKGVFDDNLIEATVANYKLRLQENLKDNDVMLQYLQDAFIKNRGESWDDYVSYLNKLRKITKTQVVSVANKYLGDNYAVVYKRQGEDSNTTKIEKPPITPIETNPDKASDFVKKMKSISTVPIKPVWIDFDKDLTQSTFKNAELLYIQNNTTDLFSLKFTFNTGKYDNMLLDIASSYMNYLPTDKYSVEEIKKKLYTLASGYNISVGSKRTTVSFYGLEENLKEVVSLFNHIITHCKPDNEALEDLKSRSLKTRIDRKANKNLIRSGLVHYAVYGVQNPFNTVVSSEKLKALKSEDLIAILKNLFKLKPSISYYGTSSLDDIKSKLSETYSMPSEFVSDPEIPTFSYATQTENTVLFTHYDMVTADIVWERNIEDYNHKLEPIIKVFNGYFGGGMSSVVFQTIRESKALAYATSTNYKIPYRKEDKFQFISYLGTQADKLNVAVNAMNILIDKLPMNKKSFALSKAEIKTYIETSRFVDDTPIDVFKSARKKGIDYDIRKFIYDRIDDISFRDLEKFHKEKIANKAYTISVVGDENKISDKTLKKIGNLKKLTLEELFGF